NAPNLVALFAKVPDKDSYLDLLEKTADYIDDLRADALIPKGKSTILSEKDLITRAAELYEKGFSLIHGRPYNGIDTILAIKNNKVEEALYHSKYCKSTNNSDSYIYNKYYLNKNSHKKILQELNASHVFQSGKVFYYKDKIQFIR